jgi:ABC-type Fe3+/spermidine/putrescine transport system ATPase subunit
MTMALSCKGICKALGGRAVLKNLDLDVSAGEVVSLLGASGSGKTTLLRIVAGLAEPDSGEITLDGRTIWSRRAAVPAEKRRVGMVFQDYALWPHMTLRRNLGFGLDCQRLPEVEATRRIAEALEVTRLAPFADRYPSELSGGQQQRVAIARCLALRPAILLFDEPLSNLDAALREDMRGEMMELVRRMGITAIYVTHDQGEAMAVSDRIAVMQAGVIAQFASPQQIYEAPASAFVASFIGGFSLLEGRAKGGLFRIEGTKAEPLRTPYAPEGAGILVVRPEDARAGGVHPHNCLRGKVLTRAYQGRCWRLAVAVGPHRLRLDWPEPPVVGDDLEFSLPPERCVVLAR